jgi:nitrate reductase NapAB chaperone NapD
MPIFAYLAMPVKGAKESLSAELAALPYCEIIPADNADVLVLVTDAPNDTDERVLQNKLQNIPSLQSLNMTFGSNDELQPERQRGDHES